MQPDVTEEERPGLRLLEPPPPSAASTLRGRLWHPSSKNRGDGPLLYICGEPEGRIIFIRIARRWESMRLVVADGWPLGLQLAARRRPRMVVLDASVPGVDGADLVKHLRQRVLATETPIIVLGDDHTPSERARFVWAGASAYHAKPLNVAEVDDSVATLLEITALA